MWQSLIIIGLALEIAGIFIWVPLEVAGLILVLIGCYRWTKEKNRHWVFTLWGLLAPIGLLGIALLRDKTWDELARSGR